MPGSVRRYINSEGIYVEETQEPQVEGEVIIFTLPGSVSGTLFVAVLQGQVLYWVPVFSRNGIVDNTTGRPWDPLARL